MTNNARATSPPTDQPVEVLRNLALIPPTIQQVEVLRKLVQEPRRAATRYAWEASERKGLLETAEFYQQERIEAEERLAAAEEALDQWILKRRAEKATWREIAAETGFSSTQGPSQRIIRRKNRNRRADT